jgi:hypothetical protein
LDQGQPYAPVAEFDERAAQLPVDDTLVELGDIRAGI